jgi:hypothetical protein
MGRRLRVGAFLAVAVVLAGCGAEVPTFRTDYPAARPGGKPLPIALIDQTGTVTAIAAAPGVDAGSDVAAVPGHPDRLRVTLAGGDCDDRVTLVLNRLGESFDLAVHDHPQFGAGLVCDERAVRRTLDITFDRQVRPERLALRTEYP